MPRAFGSVPIMHDALVQVAEMSRLPYLVVQVVPAANGANAGLGGAFDIAGDGMPDTLRMEGVEDQTIEKRSLVRKAAVAFDGCARTRCRGAPRRTLRRAKFDPPCQASTRKG
jgi:hypothetical protein